MQDDEVYDEIKKLAKKENMELFKISSVSQEGIKELMSYISKVLKELPKEEIVKIDEKVIYTLDEDDKEFEIEQKGNVFIVKGPSVDRIMRRVNIQDRESMNYLHKCLESSGIYEELRRMKIKEGDTVKILEWEFEWYE